MPSILPNQIVPEVIPFVDQDERGNLRNNHNWWLWAYNISQQVLGNTGSTAAAFAAQLNADLDADVDQADSLSLVKRVESLEKQVYEALPDPIDTRALLLAQDGLLPDPNPRAQPAQAISVGASPFTYTAPSDGTVVISGGTVSAVGWSRDGTTFFVLPIAGAIPVSRADLVKITHTGAPTASFLPR
jgi:hypothetical protein